MLKYFITPLKDDAFISNGLNILRGIAIVLVVIVHTRNFTYYTGAYQNATFMNVKYEKFMQTDWLAFGVSGVAIFFFISGYLLDLLYRRGFKAKKYAYRRFFRIFPAWALWTLFAVAVAALELRYYFEGSQSIMHTIYGSAPNVFENPKSIIVIVYSLLFMGFIFPRSWNNIVMGGWSIQVEVFNYAIFPIINRISLTSTMIFVFIIQLFIFIFRNEISSPIMVAFMTGIYWFMLGVFISRIIRKYVKREPEEINRIDLILLLGATLLTICVPFTTNYQWVNFVVLLASLLFIYLFKNNKNVNRVFKIFGKYSYGMFLNHWLFALPLSFLAALVIKSTSRDVQFYVAPIVTLILCCLVLLFSTVFSKIIFDVFENPILNWAKRKTK